MKQPQAHRRTRGRNAFLWGIDHAPQHTDSPVGERVRVLLRKRYAWPRYLFIEEVSSGTGVHGERFADGLALAMWPSSGMWLYGFEVKIGRSDLMKELKDPAKWRAIGCYCDLWWLVVTPGVWRPADELPPSWGVMECVEASAGRDEVLRIRRRPRRQETFPMDRPFIASLLRTGVATI